MKHCKTKVKLTPVEGCSPGLPGLRNSLTLPIYPVSPQELLDMISLTGLSMDSMFLVPADDVYHAKTARQILEEEHQEASALAKQLVSKR